MLESLSESSESPAQLERPAAARGRGGFGGVRFGWAVPPARLPELMDDPGLPEAEHLQALTALRRINALSFTAAGLAREVEALAGPVPAESGWTVVDVACGGGDVTIDLAARLARSRSVAGQVHVIGIDVSPRAVDRARGLAGNTGNVAAASLAFTEHDIVAAGCPPCDVAVSSLFLHHLDDEVVVTVLESMAASARLGIVISDLVRSRLGLALAVLGTTVLSGSRVARVDGPRSVRAARTPAEYRRLLDTAGLTTARIRRTWPERVLLTWSRREAAGAMTDCGEHP